MTAFLELTGVEVQLGGRRFDFNGSFTQGCTGVYGSSGAGKTTLLETIAGLRRPNSGRIALDGRTLCDSGQHNFVPPHQREIGYVPQDLALFPHLSVRQNLAYSRPTDLAFVENVAERLEISDLMHRIPQTLSGGEARRVALARALVSRPKLLLLDEPLTGLDDALKARILPFLVRVRDEFRVPMIYVSHSADEMVALCSTVAAMRQGVLESERGVVDFFVASETPSFRPREG